MNFRLQAATALALCLTLGLPNAQAASPEWESPPISHKGVLPYSDARDLYLRVLPPPPQEGSLVDRDDMTAILARQHLSADRLTQAAEDEHWLYDRFAAALGVPAIRREQFPALVQLLNRSLKQVGGPTFAAKSAYPRARPYQRMPDIHVCGKAAAAKPSLDGMRRTSYPSGHAAYGWTVGLVLARLAPARAQALLERASDYAESRLDCGMHFPSDIAAGRQLASAVVTQLEFNAEFQQDLERARAELKAFQP